MQNNLIVTAMVLKRHRTMSKHVIFVPQYLNEYDTSLHSTLDHLTDLNFYNNY